MTKKGRLLGAAFASVVLSTFFASAALAVAPTYTISLDKTAAPAPCPRAAVP